ncbi:MAG: Y-family DNA polymerase, partial [Rhodospirillaceae bacterium]|nr:Y-family DNA polymerase [Rhodospirillaceae bacterium]
ECFLDLSGLEQQNLIDYGAHIRETVIKWTGIPVSIGIGKTKTITKVANRIAKKSASADGVYLIDNDIVLKTALSQTEIGDVWGIGRRWAKMLKSNGIYSALDFANSPDGWIRKRMGVVGLRTAFELRGVSCIALEDHVPDKQTICVSRSFGKPLLSYDALHDAVSTFVSTAAEKLRSGGLVSGALCVFIRTSPFHEDHRQYSNSITIGIDPATSHTRDILKPALSALKQIYRDGYHYKKAGIILLDIVSGDNAPKTLFENHNPRDDKMMKSFDAINKKFGAGAISYGQIKRPRGWYATRNNCSPHFTTKWKDIPAAF